MQSYRFEIVRRKRRRYGWRLVATKGDRRRVIARSQRSYRSPKRAKRAIDEVRCAEVDDTRASRDRDRIVLPATSFRPYYEVVPLIVSGHIDDDADAVKGKPGARRRRPAQKAA